MAWQKRKAMGHYAVERLYRQQLSDFMDLGGLARYWHVVCPSHHRCRGRVMYSCKFLGYHLILTFRQPDDETIVSFRRLWIKGLPYTQLKRYPTLEAALQQVPFDFPQHLLELENAQPDLDNDCTIAGLPRHRRPLDPPC